jgi:hypothetical protein
LEIVNMKTKIREWLTCYWPILVVLITLCITIGAWYQRTQTLEDTVKRMGGDVTELQVSVSGIDRGVRENREDTRLILEILMKGEPGRSHANAASDSARDLELD